MRVMQGYDAVKPSRERLMTLSASLLNTAIGGETT